MYYADKLESLRDIFGTCAVHLGKDALNANGRVYPIIDDVIILLDPSQYTRSLKGRIKGRYGAVDTPPDFAEDIQFTFSDEWQRFPEILPEHYDEFIRYFDLVDIAGLRNSRVCDLGCGIGRWSYFLKDKCRELVLIDFSESIFVARNNLRSANSAIFFMGDLKRIPFRDSFADFLFCLGVLHHLPTNALDDVRKLKKYSPVLLVYLYYALDNRPFAYRILLSPVTAARMLVSKFRNRLFRKLFVDLITFLLYYPLIGAGKISNLIGLGHFIPLYEGYNGKAAKRIKQDVYDRFFTRIEQRFTKKEIFGLKDTFGSVFVSESIPYWHFLCKDKQGDLKK